MGFIKKFKNSFKVKESDEKVIEATDINEDSMKFLKESALDRDKPMHNINEITYYTCMKMLSESLGKMPLKFYQRTDKGVIKQHNHPVYDILRHRPNPHMTPAIFWSTVEYNRNHYGNAYVLKNTFKGKLKDLWILESQYVRPVIDDRGILDKNGQVGKLYYDYLNPKTGKNFTFSESDILHFRTFVSDDGFTGLSVQDILFSNLEGNKYSQKFMNKLYKSGLAAKAVLEYTGDLDQKAIERLRQGFENFASGEDNVGRIAPVPLGMKLTPLNIKLTDSQFLELKQFSSLQIAAAFGIKPNHINDYSKSSYSSSEAQNLSFYVDTLLFILNQYEQEISYKLLSDTDKENGFYFKFNVNSILRADLKTQINSLATGVNNGIYKINEAKEFLDMPYVEGGDITIVNGNYIPLTNVGEQYQKGDETDGSVLSS